MVTARFSQRGAVESGGAIVEYMSEGRGQQEPSMEEILASIRRIISEDGAPPQDAGNDRDDAAAAPAAAAATAMPATGRVDDAEEDVLLLTEMVNEDGSVVSLSGTAEPGPDPVELTTEPSLPEPPQPVAEEASPPPASPPPQAPSPPEPEPELGVTEPEPEVESEPEPMMDVAEKPEQPTMPAAARMDEALPEQAERLVSDTTFAASTAALSQLSRTIRKDRDFPLGGGRMVEDLVREALEPMLKTWLDANLQAIVERLVRQEIERMIRRAEEE